MHAYVAASVLVSSSCISWLLFLEEENRLSSLLVDSSLYPYAGWKSSIKLNKGVIFFFFENLTKIIYNFRTIAKVGRDASDTESSDVSYKLYYK